MSKCAICEKTVVGRDNPSFPFCSRRCKMIDLGNWLGETYRVAEPSLLDLDFGTQPNRREES